jgi:hypothetical protein
MSCLIYWCNFLAFSVTIFRISQHLLIFARVVLNIRANCFFIYVYYQKQFSRKYEHWFPRKFHRKCEDVNCRYNPTVFMSLRSPSKSTKAINILKLCVHNLKSISQIVAASRLAHLKCFLYVQYTGCGR